MRNSLRKQFHKKIRRIHIFQRIKEKLLLCLKLIDEIPLIRTFSSSHKLIISTKLSNVKSNFLLKELSSLRQNTHLQWKRVNLTDKGYVYNVFVPKITKIVKRVYLADLQTDDQKKRNEMLACREKTYSRIPPAITSTQLSSTLTNSFVNTGIYSIKHSYLLNLNESLTDIFMEHLIIAFRWNKNQKYIISQRKL